MIRRVVCENCGKPMEWLARRKRPKWYSRKIWKLCGTYVRHLDSGDDCTPIIFPTRGYLCSIKCLNAHKKHENELKKKCITSTELIERNRKE